MRDAAFQYARISWRITNDDDWTFKKLSDEEVRRTKSEYDEREEARHIEKAVERLLSKDETS